MDILQRETEFKAAVNRFSQYPQQMLDDFFDYWSEPNKANTKMRFEMEKTWHLERRLRRWHSHQVDFKPFKAPEISPLPTTQKSIKDRFRSPLLRDGITIQEWVAEFQKEQPDLTKIDLTFINQSCIPNSEKWMKAVMQTWYSK
ncbi:MAG TPA: hypothetical protein V6C58_01555, partial [Allocoleopsis sp.]